MHDEVLQTPPVDVSFQGASAVDDDFLPSGGQDWGGRAHRDLLGGDVDVCDVVNDLRGYMPLAYSKGTRSYN